MKLYKISIKPTSNFATPLKGDTIFGQMCWMIRYKYGEKRLEELLSYYDDNPFMIVSDGFAKDYLPKPNMPSSYLGENIDDKKNNRKKVWLSLEELLSGKYTNAKNDDDIKNINTTSVVAKNSINYKTFTTDKEGFAPFGEEESTLSSRDIYVLLSEKFSSDELKEIFSLLSQFGYGKNTTIGKGRFEVTEFMEIEKINHSSKTYMALSPFVASGDYKNIFYEPFTRFGKHGAGMKNPFKKPLLLANSGAVVEFESEQNIQYVGASVKNYSFSKKTVHQGYSILLPLKELMHA